MAIILPPGLLLKSVCLGGGQMSGSPVFSTGVAEEGDISVPARILPLRMKDFGSFPFRVPISPRNFSPDAVQGRVSAVLFSLYFFLSRTSWAFPSQHKSP
ncbi:hypothetical protein TNCT_540531 [Trichonephila clavata]|uniref:Uncharacterized protein n=1 Tax=Trichonephila clavata TaxID=2740835 RepID=A0A8X6HQM2_TRICU|nr:hypothetical protein TNCT_540531 [Trichonephila clavata]